MSGSSSLRLQLAPSYRLAVLIVALHGAAGACIYAVGGGTAGAALAIFVATLGGAAAWDRALLRGGRSPRAVEISADGMAQVEFRAGSRCAVAPEPRHVNRFCVTLPLPSALRRTVLIAADMLAPADFRLLRLWALWGRLPGVASGQLPA